MEFSGDPRLKQNFLAIETRKVQTHRIVKQTWIFFKFLSISAHKGGKSSLHKRKRRVAWTNGGSIDNFCCQNIAVPSSDNEIGQEDDTGDLLKDQFY